MVYLFFSQIARKKFFQTFADYTNCTMTKLNIILGVSCLLNVCWSTQASKPANAIPFPCPEEVKTPLIDSSVAFYASTPMECQIKSIHMKAYANVWADIGVCFPLFDKIYKNLPGPVVLNSDHWCFDKHSTNASPVFHEALAMKRANGIGKKKNTGIEDDNKKKDNTKNKKKKNKQKQKNGKKDTGDKGQDTNDRKLQTLSQGTDFYVDSYIHNTFDIQDLASLASMTLYLQTNNFDKFQQIPITRLDGWLRSQGIDFRPVPQPKPMTDEEIAHSTAEIVFGVTGLMGK
jgi:hypothetical protein